MYLAYTGVVKNKEKSGFFNESQKNMLAYSYGLGVFSRHVKDYYLAASSTVRTTNKPGTTTIKSSDTKIVETGVVGATSVISSSLDSSILYKTGAYFSNVVFGASSKILRGITQIARFVAKATTLNVLQTKAGLDAGAANSATATTAKLIAPTPKIFGALGTIVPFAASIVPIISAAAASKKTIDDTYAQYGLSLTAPTKMYGPGYDTSAMKYSLDMNMQNRGLNPLAKSTEGLSLAMYNLRHKGYL